MEETEIMGKILDGQKFHADNSRCIMKEVFNQDNCNLNWLSMAELFIQNSSSAPQSFKGEEVLLANLKGPVTVAVEGQEYVMEHYDMLYIPIDTTFRVKHSGDEEAWVYVYRATGDVRYTPYHAKYAECIKDKKGSVI